MKLKLNWLKEEQRKFLSRGYLRDHETPEDRYATIISTIKKYGLKMAKTEESKDYINGIDERFKEYFENGWVSLSTPVLRNFGAKDNLPISCVTGDTWINTLEGGKKASEIEVGDEVLTHKNRFKKVVNVIKTLDKNDIWEMKLSTRMTPLRITGNHLVKTNLGWTRVDELDPNEHLVAINGKLNYDSEDIFFNTEKYFKDKYIVKENKLFRVLVNTKNNTENIDTNFNPINNEVKLTENLAWAIGLWYADGSLTMNDRKKPNGIRLTQSLQEEDIINKWLDVIYESFGVKGKYSKTNVKSKYSKRGESEWITANVNSTLLGTFFEEYFGKYSLNKTIPNELLNAPKNILERFLEGFISGDGTITKDGKSQITISNPKLLLQIYQISLKIGATSSLQMQCKPSKYNKTKYVYRITFLNYKISKNKKYCGSAILFEDGLYYTPIRSLKTTNDVEDVYDFTVEEDHSFSCAGVVVHNCNHGILSDSLDGIYKGMHETGMLAKHGAGTAVNFSDIRPLGSDISTGGKSNSVLDWIELYADMMSKTAQNASRRGFLTAYLSLDHPEIMDFLDIGTEAIPRDKQRFFQTITTAVTIPEGWRKSLMEGDLEKRKIFTKLLNTRKQAGFPYILDIENSNKGISQAYIDKGMKIRNSNICSEAIEYADYEKTFACCLSSENAYYFDEYKNHPFFRKDMNIMLDCVIEEYIEKGSKLPGLENAVRFAKEHRAIGLGITGFHSYLQKNMIPFGSTEAYMINDEIFSSLREQSDEASKWMAEHFGEPKILEGYGFRNTSRLAQAPKKSTTFIDGGTHLALSEGIEPHKSNFTEKKLAKIQVEFKNKELEKLLIKIGKNTDDVWDGIANQNGSVQHLEFLNEKQKDVFKTFSEISQMDVIQLAAARQEYIDMGQSINLMVHPDTPAKDIIKLHLKAFELGIKSLYYQYSINAAQRFSQELLSCSSCEG